METESIFKEKNSKTETPTFLSEWKVRRENEIEWFKKWITTDEYKRIIADLKQRNAEQGLTTSSTR